MKNPRVKPVLMLAMLAGLVDLVILASSATFAYAGDSVSFGGIPLPPPRPVQGAGGQPPAAWLIVRHTATPATFGSFCYGGICADMVPPEMMPHVATVSVSRGTRLTVVIGVARVKSVQASLSPWHVGMEGQPKRLAVRARTVGRFVAVGLPELGAVRNQVLSVFVRFPPKTPNADPHVEGGDAVYLWHLNPVPR